MAADAEKTAFIVDSVDVDEVSEILSNAGVLFHAEDAS